MRHLQNTAVIAQSTTTTLQGVVENIIEFIINFFPGGFEECFEWFGANTL